MNIKVLFSFIIMDKEPSQESILIKKMLENLDEITHHITYEDDDELKLWKEKIESYSNTIENCPHQCPGLPARMRTAQPSSLPDVNLHQEARTQVSLEIAQLELPQKIRKLRKE